MLKFALVGCGRIAQRHAELLGEGHVPGAELVGVCDVRDDRARSLAAKHGVQAFTEMHEMMQVVQPDVVAVLTESGRHAQHVIELAPHGRHVIVEKPMALTLSDADRMIRACDEAGIRLFVVKQNRFNVPIVKAHEALEAGRFGKLVLGTVRVRWCRTQDYYDQDSWRGTWALDGGVLSNQASHHIDMLEWFMGDVDTVVALSNTALVDIEAEDTAVVALRFASGALGIVEATTAARPRDLEGSISILGEKGSVVVGGFAMNQMQSWEFAERQEGDEDVLTRFSVNPPDVYGFGHNAFYHHVVECLREDKAQLVDGLVGRKSLELITAIYESIETKQEVRLRFAPNRSRLGQQHG